MDGVMFSYHGARGPELDTALCLEEFVKWQDQLDVSQTTTVATWVWQSVYQEEWSLLSTVAWLVSG